jgi:hypothetical protein
MKTNLEKWNHYKALLEEKANTFMNSINTTIPETFYTITGLGNIQTCTVINRHYSFNPSLYFSGKKPTKEDVKVIKSVYENEIIFNPEQIYFDYSYVWGEKYTASTSIKIKDLFDENKTFFVKEEAEKAAIAIKAKVEENNLFHEKHKKTANYDYKSNGYKFLGWQNGWKHVYLDEDGKITTGDISKGEKPKNTFTYLTEDHPEYSNCITQKHRRIEVQHTRSGSENTVSCPTCMIYWKYDCSD